MFTHAHTHTPSSHPFPCLHTHTPSSHPFPCLHTHTRTHTHMHTPSSHPFPCLHSIAAGQLICNYFGTLLQVSPQIHQQCFLPLLTLHFSKELQITHILVNRVTSQVNCPFNFLQSAMFAKAQHSPSITNCFPFFPQLECGGSKTPNFNTVL